MSEPVDRRAPPTAISVTEGDATEWRLFEGVHYRLETDGNVSCYSINGRDCRPGEPDPRQARPLVCGAAHRDSWKVTGYDDNSHWCNRVYANVFAKWENYGALGFNALLAMNPEGHMMCATSADGTCKLDDERRKPTPEEKIEPLVCGAAHQARFNTTGYERETPANWCKAPLIVARVPKTFSFGPSRLHTGGFDNTKLVMFDLSASLQPDRGVPILGLVGHRAGAIVNTMLKSAEGLWRWTADKTHYKSRESGERTWSYRHLEKANTVFARQKEIGVGQGLSLLTKASESDGIWADAQRHWLEVQLMDNDGFQKETSPSITELVIAYQRRLPTQ
jgi:hypothetical protein